MSMSNEQFKQEHAMMLREKHTETVKNIRELQELEKYMFQNLERLTGQDDQSQAEKQIVEKINELSNMRIGLFNELKNMYTSSQDDLESERNQLADQIAIVGVVESELNRLKSNIDSIKQEKDNKVRMVQIGNYEAARYNSHISVMQIIVFSSLIVLASSLLLQNGVIPPMVSSGIIILTVAGGIIMILNKVFDMMSRNNMDYSKYDFAFDPAQAKPGYETVYDHDKIFFSKLGGELRSDYNDSKNKISSTVGGLSKTSTSMDSSMVGALTNNTMNKPNAVVVAPGSNNKVEGEVSKSIENFASY
jgi:hypothetical protein